MESPDAPAEIDGADEDALFPIVGVGASAGGLEAFTQLLEALPSDTGMAFVLVQHLAPTHPSALVEILSRSSTMPITEVLDVSAVEPNHVYVIPPARGMVILQGTLHLMPREGHRVHHPIDQFFRALAEDRGHQAIGVVLSGNASDGTIGLEAIKAAGGITFAQDSSAQYRGMPQSAIASGFVDFVMPPEAIAGELARIARHAFAEPAAAIMAPGDEAILPAVIHQILQVTGVDFTHYKISTLYRRITRRMVLRKIERLDDYVRFLETTPAEVEALFQDILINVTSFFRDPSAFEVLEKDVFPRLIRDRPNHEPVRMWTIGCSTGQEAYSLAIAFAEAAEAENSSAQLQLFATDLNASSVEIARTGVYSKDIERDVSPERLRKYFSEVDDHYRISKSIRDACIFSRHNILSDPPFSRIDMASCRNLLIYLDPVLQQRTLSTLHYSLKPGGALWLGSSETNGAYRGLFEVVDASNKIYSRKPGSSAQVRHFPLHTGAMPRVPFVPITVRPSGAAVDLTKEADRLLVSRFAPPGVLVSADLDILQYRGDTGIYLSPAPGKASLSLLKMLREGLLVAVRSALRLAASEKRAVRTERLRIKYGNEFRDVKVEVIPVRGNGPDEGGFLVLFEEPESGKVETAESGTPPVTLPDADIVQLEQELSATRDYLQSVIEQQDAANEELQSANEEVQSANEELQSVNEELETSKEEIQSSNEELATVNDELSNRNLELNRLNSDLVNLFGSVQIAIVIVGPDLRIRRFTKTAETLIHLKATDVGRPLTDIRLDFEDLPDLEPVLRQVIDTASNRESDVRNTSGHWYSLRVRPYRTLDDTVDGAVVMLVDIDVLKRANEYIGSIVSTVREPLLVLDADLRVRTASRAYYERFRVSSAETEGRFVYEIGSGEWDIPELRGLLDEVLRTQSPFDDFEVESEFESLGRRTMMLNGRRLLQADGSTPYILLAIQDVSEKKQADEELRASEIRYRRLFESAKDGILILDAATATITDANPFLVRLLGCTRDDLIGKELWEIGLFKDIEASKAAVRELQENEYIRYDNLPLETTAGQRIDVELVSNVYGEANHRVIQCNIRDISVRKHLQDLEREGERRLRFVMDSMPQKVITAKPNGDVDYFNPQWTAFTGRSFEQIKGWGWTSFIHPDDLGETVRLWQQSIQTGNVFLMEHRFRRSDGEYRWHLSQTLPLRDEKGHIVMWIGSSTDVHQQRQSANRLQQLAADLSDSDSRKNEFLAMLAHELRNPLAPILNALKVIRMSDWDREAARSASEMMERQVGQMVRLVDDLLDVSRISRGKIELRLSRIELQSAIRQAVEAARPLIESLNHELTVTLPPQQLYLNADATRLAQVFGNLLNNACKFTERAGRISLSVEQEEGQAVIRIKDSGIGIESSQLVHVFDIFVQVDTSLERATTGLGIGLTLVKSLVEMHHGTVEARSDGIGCGSEFVVRLPLHMELGKLAPSMSASDDSSPTTGKRILVVDDNRDSADSMALLLKLSGNETHTAADGLEAIEAAQSLRPDVILLDIGLPSLNGYEVCRRIRAQDWGKRMVMVALTGWGQDDDRKKSSEAGFNAHVVKPVEFDDLVKLLSELLAVGNPD
jgi:two-component system CheB/CheR fusion protein